MAPRIQEMVEQLQRQLTEQEKLIKTFMAGAAVQMSVTGLPPAYGTTGSSDPISVIQMSERLGSKAVDATVGSSKVSVTQPPNKPA